jgi:hypothetical protein
MIGENLSWEGGAKSPSSLYDGFPASRFPTTFNNLGRQAVETMGRPRGGEASPEW